MKSVKRDSKYIIKRILIGVGIALILANLRKCNVYAETTDINVILNQGPISFTTSSINPQSFYYSLPSPYNDNIIYNFYSPFALSNSNNNKSYISFYNQLYNVYLYYFFPVMDPYDIDVSDIKISWNDVSQMYSFYFKCNDIENNQFKDACLENNGYLNINGSTSAFILSNNNNLDLSNIMTSSGSSSTSKYDSPINNDYFYTNGGYAIIKEDFFDNAVVYSFDNINSFSINNEEISLSPYGYSEIDISDYQAVYFIPKNYQTVSTHQVDNTTFIDFPFYYKGNINRGYFNIKDNNQVVFNPLTDTDNSESDFSFIDASFPMYYDERVSHDLSGYIIYNIGKETKVRYKSNEYNYYLVKDLSDYADEINYINDNGEEVSDYISFTKTLQEKWEMGFSAGGDEWVDNGYANGGLKEKLSKYFDILKLPFTFLKNLSRDKCQPISIPIPFTNGNIQLSCLSTIFHNVLGNTFYNLLFAVITGLYAYRITIHNIDTITDGLNPSDDKIEVVDL